VNVDSSLDRHFRAFEELFERLITEAGGEDGNTPYTYVACISMCTCNLHLHVDGDCSGA